MNGGAIAYEFDAAGNVTQRGELSLVIADDGTVIAIDLPAVGKSRFFRDHRNLRVATSGAFGNERFVHSAAGDLELRLLDSIAEPCGTGQVREVTPVEHYVYLGGRRVAMVAGRLEGTCGAVGGAAVASVDESHFYFADKMDLARAVYRESDGRAVWRGELDAFSMPLGAGINDDPDGDGVGFAQAFRLPGQQEIRGTELSENWYRVLDRVAGRYLQIDPALPYRLKPFKDHAYAYTANHPLRATDRSGAIVVHDLLGACDNCDAKSEAENRQNWIDGLALARAAATTERCYLAFRPLGVDIYSVLMDGTPPNVDVGARFRGDANFAMGQYRPIRNRVQINCLALFDKRVAARTLLHELHHWAADQARRFGHAGGEFQNGPLEEWEGASEVEDACFP